MRSFGVVRRLAPTQDQVEQLGRSLGACRFAQNTLLALKGADRSTIKDTAFAELMALFNNAIS